MRTHGTCIVGIAHKKNVWMGADSMASDNYFKTPRKEKKLFRLNDEMLIGMCGPLRTMDIIECEVIVPERAEDVTDREYIIRQFIPAMRKALGDSGALVKEDGVEDMCADMLLAYRGRLYVIESDFCLREEVSWCVGSGAAFGLGSLYATRDGEPTKRIRTALQAAAHYSPSVGPPFAIEKL